MNFMLKKINTVRKNANAVRKNTNAAQKNTGSIYLSQDLGLFFGVARDKDAGGKQSLCRVFGKVYYQQLYARQTVICTKCRVAEFSRKTSYFYK